VAEEFEEIAHSGGRIVFTTAVDSEGRQSFRIRIEFSGGGPAQIFGIYALSPGIPVETIRLAGLGVPWNPSPVDGAIPVFIASDSEGFYGHQCPKCQKYWRSRGLPTCCAYCGLKGSAHTFVTEAQGRYIQSYIGRLHHALGRPEGGTHVIDMDEVAAAVGKDGSRPAFYYSEERQQTHFKCAPCGGENDILGRFGYCSNCGSRNDVAEFAADIAKLRDRINTGSAYHDCVRDGVSLFDVSAGQYMRQLVECIPLTPGRQNRLSRMRFHDLESSAEAFNIVFDIDILKGLRTDDVEFAKRMFHRRHVYEHSGGEVDDKYLRDSGDTSVRLKQVIRETKETAHRLASLLVRMQRNLHEGFHSIFPPDHARIRDEAARKVRPGQT
jgi:hypothetical protein